MYLPGKDKPNVKVTPLLEIEPHANEKPVVTE